MRAAAASAAARINFDVMGRSHELNEPNVCRDWQTRFQPRRMPQLECGCRSWIAAKQRGSGNGRSKQGRDKMVNRSRRMGGGNPVRPHHRQRLYGHGWPLGKRLGTLGQTAYHVRTRCFLRTIRAGFEGQLVTRRHDVGCVYGRGWLRCDRVGSDWRDEQGHQHGKGAQQHHQQILRSFPHHRGMPQTRALSKLQARKTLTNYGDAETIAFLIWESGAVSLKVKPVASRKIPNWVHSASRSAA